MFNVFRSNRQERLADAFAGVLASKLGPSLDVQDWIAVQSRPMETWLRTDLAKRLGIFAGARFSFPRALIEYLLGLADANRNNDWAAFSQERLTWSIMERLPEFIDKTGFEEPRRYLKGDRESAKEFQLSRQIARAFDEYAVYRPEMVLGWEKNRPEEWQAKLWNALVDKTDSVHIARGAVEYFNALSRRKVDLEKALPRASLFGISNLPPLFLKILYATGSKTEVNLFALSPSKEFWTHIRRSRRQSESHDLDDMNPLLTSMGTIERDFQANLEEVGSYHEPRDDLYEEPCSKEDNSLLEMLQSDILSLVNRGKGNAPPLEIANTDTSLQIHSCGSPMREVEALHDILLNLFDDAELALRPGEVLVMIPDLKTYGPFIDAVFSTGTNGSPAIPYKINGLGIGTGLKVVTAFFQIIDLASSRVTLQEVFDLLRIEPVREHFGLQDSDVDTALEWASRAGIRWGIDGDHRAYHEQPSYSENTWQFGLGRLFLGYAIPGEIDSVFLIHCPMMKSREATH